MPILLLLPCNQGAQEGNFFPYGGWKQALLSLEKYHIPKTKVDFAAVDSIITQFDPKGDKNEKGAIVNEWEMERVKGYDLKPTWTRFHRDHYTFLRKHTHACEIGLQRLLPKYEYVVVVLNVRGYKYAVIRALRNLAKNMIPPNVTVIDCGESPSYLNNGIKLAMKYIHRFLTEGTYPGGKIIRPRILPLNSKFLIRPQDLPEDFIYWHLDCYRSQEKTA